MALNLGTAGEAHLQVQGVRDPEAQRELLKVERSLIELKTEIERQIAPSGSGIAALNDLTDVNTTGQLQFDLLYNADGTNWVPTAGLLQWDGTNLTINTTGGLFGGLLTTESLTIGGNDSGVDAGFVNMNSPVIFGAYSGVAGATYGFSYTATESFGLFVGGGLNFSGTIATTSGVFIYESFRGAPAITTGATPGFAAYTVLQSLPLLRGGNLAAESPYNALIVNAGATVENPNIAVAQTTATQFGLSFSPQTRTTGAFGTMSVTNQTAVSCRPTFSTVSTSVVNLGTVRGLHQQNPGVALFQPQAGTETMTANVAVDVDNIAFGGNVTKAAVRSAQTAASNAYFLLQTGNAQSQLRGQLQFPLDLTGITFGASNDFNMGWTGTNELFLNFITAPAAQMRLSSETAGGVTDRFLFSSQSLDSEFNFNCERFSIGAQTGAVGNQVAAFVTPARTATINGSWADFLLTHAGNITIDATLSDLSAWVINAPSITSGTGSITGFVAGLQVGQTNSGLGGADTMALRSNGRIHLRGVMEFPALSPAQLTADVNDYEPATGSAMRQVWRVSANAARTITGIVAQQGGDTQVIKNVGANLITISHENVGSAAANRINLPGGTDIVLALNESIHLYYDELSLRWHCIGSCQETPAASPAYTVTNGTTDRTYDANSTTLNELADVVATMIADLQTAEILG